MTSCKKKESQLIVKFPKELMQIESYSRSESKGRDAHRKASDLNTISSVSTGTGGEYESDIEEGYDTDDSFQPPAIMPRSDVNGTQIPPSLPANRRGSKLLNFLSVNKITEEKRC